MVAYKSFGCNLNKRSHIVSLCCLQKTFAFSQILLSLSVFTLLYKLVLNFIRVHSTILLGLIGYGTLTISRDFLRFLPYRKHSLCFLDVCWNSSFRLGSLCLIEIETYALMRACFRRSQAILLRVEGFLNSKTVFSADKLPNAKRCKRILMALLFIAFTICLLIG